MISGATYLPRIWQIGYLNDDWYLMYSAQAYGHTAFIDIFSVDRPVRAWVMMTTYLVFGKNPIYYNLSAFFFRFLSACGYLWLLRLLWPRRRSVILLAALLFLIYPGFLSQINGVDYQSQLIGLAAAIFSIVFTLKAIAQKKIHRRLAFLLGAIFLGWFYLGLVEYFLGFEAIRIMSVYILTARGQFSLKQKALSTIKDWWPSALAPAIFLVWRIFFYHTERGATDISLQMETFLRSPLITGLWWLAHIIQDSLDVIIGAWVIPLSQLFEWMRLRDVFFTFAVTAFILVLTFWVISRIKSQAESVANSNAWRNEMLLFGILSVPAALLPVILVNRQVEFTHYSRYALASSTGVALILVVFISMLSNSVIRSIVVGVFLGISVFTHHANTIKAIQVTEDLRSFWWQVNWRIPQIESGTTISGNYPIAGFAEDYFFWGPANLIYYPVKGHKGHIQPVLYAMVPNQQAINAILTSQGQKQDKRKTITTYPNPRNLLIITRASQDACVRVLDGKQPELSSADPPGIKLVAAYSEIEHIILESDHPVPSSVVFGPEPPHNWCYYYQQATLARQKGDWDEVIRLGEQARDQNMKPKDMIEWLPFLQAYAVLDKVNELNDISMIVKEDLFVQTQACRILSAMSNLSDEIRISLKTNLCNEQ